MEQKNKNKRFFSDIKPVLTIKKKEANFVIKKSIDEVEIKKPNKISFIDIKKPNQAPANFNKNKVNKLKKQTFFDIRREDIQSEKKINNIIEQKNKGRISTIEKVKTQKVLKKTEYPLESKVKKFNFNLVEKGTIFLKNVFFWKKSLAVFVLISFFLMSSIKGLAFFQKDVSNTKSKIVDDTNVAYQYLLSGQSSIMENDFEMAFYKFNVAAERFKEAEQELNKAGDGITYLLKVVPGGSAIFSGKNLLEAGANISYASKCLAEALKPFSKTEDIFAVIKNKENQNSGSDKLPFTVALTESFENFLLAQKNIEKAKSNMEKVNPEDFPEEIRPQVEKIKYSLPKLEEGLNYFVSNLDVLLEILGHKQPKKYLLIFQNNRELRPTGGFIGTYGLFDMKEGKMENLKVEGPYNVDGQMIEKIVAPEALRLIQPRFYMRDANWFLDFPTSAKKMILLHEKTGGPTVDGVFSFNASVFEDLLKITGPVEMPEYNLTINDSNFFEKAQEEVEINYDRQLNEPKKFIADLLPKMFEKVSSLEKDKAGQLLGAFLNNFYKKDILVYFTNENIENISRDFGFTGEVRDTDYDYLSVVSTNIGGGKTDQVIKQNVDYYSEIQLDGSIVNTVKIRRKHNGDKNNFWTSIKNMTFLRVYVPSGSTLIEARGFDKQFYDVLLPKDVDAKEDPLISSIEQGTIISRPSMTRISEESGKTVFGNFIGLEVGQEKEITLKYQLPFKVSLENNELIKKYSLFIQKQPGASKETNFVGKINYPSDLNIVWQHPDQIFIDQNQINFETKLDTDKAYAVMFGKKE